MLRCPQQAEHGGSGWTRAAGDGRSRSGQLPTRAGGGCVARALTESSDLVLAFDSSTVITWCNTACLHILRFSPRRSSAHRSPTSSTPTTSSGRRGRPQRIWRVDECHFTASTGPGAPTAFLDLNGSTGRDGSMLNVAGRELIDVLRTSRLWAVRRGDLVAGHFGTPDLLMWRARPRVVRPLLASRRSSTAPPTRGPTPGTSPWPPTKSRQPTWRCRMRPRSPARRSSARLLPGRIPGYLVASPTDQPGGACIVI